MKKLLIMVVLFVICVSVIQMGISADELGSVISVSVQTYPNKTVYGAFEEFDKAGLSLRAVYDDGSERIIQGSEVSVIYQKDKTLRVGDSYVTICYGGAQTRIPVTVNRISYDLSLLELNSFSVTYNGKYQSYSQMLPTIIGQDGIPLVMSAVGGSINAGSYDIKIDFHTDSKDYIVPATRVVTMTIQPYSPELVWGDTEFIYDGKSKLPSAYCYDVFGNKIYPTVTGSAINAGTYTATADINDPNYVLENPEISYEIKKASYDFSGIKWSEDSFVYDGSKKSISLSGLPGGVSVIGYVNDRAINAGEYTVTASLSWDEQNYNQPPIISHHWKIIPAEYDMSKTVFKNAEFVYDGKIHYPILDGRMPTGADGITLQYSFLAGATHVADGTVTVDIIFYTESENYCLPKKQTASVRILPKGVSVIWGEGEIFYNGKYSHPTVYSDECELRVLGGGIGVGSYRATAVTENSDYFILNDSIDFVIKKASNAWEEIPEASVCFEGKDIKLRGKPLFGDPSFLFFSDEKGEHRITAPKSCGVYYAKICVAETENYYGIESDIIPFEIIKIAPISFEVEITKEIIKAYEHLRANDFACYIKNNDGSLEKVDSSVVKVIYENADSFRRKDNTVEFLYGDYRIYLPITVEYADYDLSNIVWLDSSVEYDGDPKTPTLDGLPEGIEIVEYIGGEVTNAGTYTVEVTVRFDDENYNEPIIPSCRFEIRKKVIPIPTFSTIYNGIEQFPVSRSAIFTVISQSSYLNAGEYTVIAKLNDPDNYTFADNMGEECESLFIIDQMTVSALVSDVNKYLFEKPGQATYTLSNEDIILSDRVDVEQYIENGRVYIRSLNPNYRLSFEPGVVKRLWYPSKAGSIYIVIALAITILISLLGALGYVYKDKIIGAVAVLRCRWYNRAVSVFPPKWNQPKPSADDISYNSEVEWSFGESEYVREDEETEKSEVITDKDPDFEEKDVNTEMSDSEISFELNASSVDAERADNLITDSLAKSLIKKYSEVIYTSGSAKGVINVNLLSENFSPGDRVDVNSLKEKGLVSSDTAYIKVLAGGSIDKSLTVYANDFSLSAVKMIALTGGEAIKIATLREKSSEQ